MKLYNKPELNVEKFDVEDIITVSGGDDSVNSEKDNGIVDVSAGMEFDITAEGNEF